MPSSAQVRPISGRDSRNWSGPSNHIRSLHPKGCKISMLWHYALERGLPFDEHHPICSLAQRLEPMSMPALVNSREAKRMQPRILIADDQPDVQRALALLLKGHGYVTE